MDTLEVTLPFNTWIPKQRSFYDFEPKGKLSVEAILGSWGFGKTTGAARKAVKRCLRNGWHSGYGNSQPMGAILAPTYKILYEATLPKFLEAIPPELIDYQKGFPNPHLQLRNGLKILLASAEASMEGLDLCFFWIDEISDKVFSSQPQKYLNYLARLRDSKCQGPLTMLASGLPLAGWVRETFETTGDEPDRITILGGTEDNPYIPKETREAMLQACPAGWEGVLLRGDWGLPVGATFPMWDVSRHLTRDRGDPNLPVSAAIDIGNHGAVLVGQRKPMEGVNLMGQPITQQGLLIVDQLLTEFESVERACYKLKIETPWQFIPGKSEFYVDPTIRRDELNAIRKHFPGCRIVVRDREDEFYRVDNGIEHVQVCMRDAQQNSRLQVWDGLKGVRYGVVSSIENAKGNPRTGQPYVKDDRHDHSICALRYLACGMLPARARVKPSVST